jgi:hypothetical protein
LAELSDLDVPRLLRTLEAHRVEYVLVGGVAAGARGATRATEDLDLDARPATSIVSLLRWATFMRVCVSPASTTTKLDSFLW